MKHFFLTFLILAMKPFKHLLLHVTVSNVRKLATSAAINYCSYIKIAQECAQPKQKDLQNARCASTIHTEQLESWMVPRFAKSLNSVHLQ